MICHKHIVIKSPLKAFWLCNNYLISHYTATSSRHNSVLILITKTSFILQYAKETQHEKILRGLAVGISLTMYERLEEADALIESLCRDKDPILRWSGMFTIAMAYCGSANNQAIRKLLHVAVS